MDIHIVSHGKLLYMANSKLFILTSLWEDPGFVLVEAALNNLTIFH